MQESQPHFLSLAAKTAVCHTITYFLAGVVAYNVFNYAAEIARPCSGMRPMSDPLVRAGVLFQPLRGLLFASVFYPFRERLFGRKNGWLLMAWMLIGLGILGTFAAPAGSMEGYIYTITPVLLQMRGYLEIGTQALLLSALLAYWVNNPGKKWLTWLLSVAMAIICGLVVLGLFVPAK